MSSIVDSELLKQSDHDYFTIAERTWNHSVASGPSIETNRYLEATRIAHRVLAMILIVPAAPLIAAAMVLIRATSRGPAIYRQSRVGLGGRHFQLLKLRTMTHNAEADTGPVWTAIKDPRITRLGRFLRKLHLDELPQLWNVVRGEMALIGPRPERPEFVVKLAAAIPDYVERLAALPGVTGLAQITLPPDLTLECVRRKLTEDIRYIETANLFLDFRILLCTALRATGLPGGVAARATGFRQFASSSADIRSYERIPGVRPAVSSLQKSAKNAPHRAKRKAR
jgi:lipopolysaccharide/colanic/teichoic acid biosynthesis glycosyltransferase